MKNEMTVARKLQYAATNWDYGEMLHVYFTFTEPCLMPNGNLNSEYQLVQHIYI